MGRLLGRMPPSLVRSDSDSNDSGARVTGDEKRGFVGSLTFVTLWILLVSCIWAPSKWCLHSS